MKKGQSIFVNSEKEVTMDDLKPKQNAYIRSVGRTGVTRHHLLDMCNGSFFIFR